MASVPGIPIVISGPSGVGKGTLISRLLQLRNDTVASISMTTRPPRPEEEDGVHYFFVTADQFRHAIEHNELIEWANVYNHQYGTPRSNVNKKVEEGLDVILEIDVQGAASARTLCRDGVFIYILPPSLDVLRERLFNRKKGAGDDLEQRISQARSEWQFIHLYDYCIVNDEVDTAVAQLDAILTAERLRRKRQQSWLHEQGIL